MRGRRKIVLISFGLLLCICKWALSQADSSPHKIQMIEVEPGVRLEVLDWGGSGRPIIFLAGSGDTAHPLWRTSSLPAHRSLSGQVVLRISQEARALRTGRGKVAVFDPDAGMPRPNRGLIYFGACIIAGLRLAREKRVSVRVIPTSHTIEESVDLAHEIFNRVFRKVPERIK